LAGRALTELVGGPAQVLSFGTRFTSPVVVGDDDEGTSVEVAAVVTAVDDDGATIEMTVTSRGQRVLGATRAVVRC
jgi:hypothetical protein